MDKKTKFGNIVVREDDDGTTVYLTDDDLPGVVRRNLRVEWVDLGEGYNGDYNPDDPDDQSLLRFDAFHKNDENVWDGDCGSFCTLVPADTPFESLIVLAKTVMSELSPTNWKRTCEAASWIGQTEDLEEAMKLART